MAIILIVFVLAVVLELGMQFVPLLWRARKAIAGVCVILTAFAGGAIVLLEPNIPSVIIGMIGLYRIFNYIRIVEGRMHEHYLRYATRRTGLVLLALQAIVGAYWWVWQVWAPGTALVWVGLAVAQLLVAAVLLFSVIRNLRTTRWHAKTKHLTDNELPTITVAIPARNETADLQDCLESIIPSDYPKLEILVLDDCSQTKKTPEIIRSYAHDGVRFIQGEEPRDTWLAKNQAYDRLADEASGEYIVFCGVDVRFGRSSLRQLAGLLYGKQKEMISILPYRAEGVRRQNAYAQSMRYFWELVPPRRLFNRPPVLSSCWIISKEALRKAGGFDAVARAIVPEAHFARSLVRTDGYSFLRASSDSGIESVKSLADQRETAVRTRYPQLHKRPENVLVLTAGTLLFMLGPFALAAAGFFVEIGLAAQLLAAVSAILLITTYSLLTRGTRTGMWWFGWLGLPLGMVYDMGLVHYSMWQYEFSEVEWKGRNVCIPAMHVIPHLPKI